MVFKIYFRNILYSLLIYYTLKVLFNHIFKKLMLNNYMEIFIFN